MARAPDARRVAEAGLPCGCLLEVLVGDEELEVAARLADVHLYLLAIHEELAEVA
jgi:hypothetical protein